MTKAFSSTPSPRLPPPFCHFSFWALKPWLLVRQSWKFPQQVLICYGELYWECSVSGWEGLHGFSTNHGDVGEVRYCSGSLLLNLFSVVSLVETCCACGDERVAQFCMCQHKVSFEMCPCFLNCWKSFAYFRIINKYPCLLYRIKRWTSNLLGGIWCITKSSIHNAIFDVTGFFFDWYINVACLLHECLVIFEVSIEDSAIHTIMRIH